MDAVGADRHVAALLSAVGEAHGHAGLVLRHPRALAPELDRVPGGLGEDTLQVGPGYGDIRRSESLGHVGDVPGVEQLPAAAHVLGLLHLVAESLDLVGHPELLQGPHAVRPDEEGRADLAELLRALEDLHVDARPAQPDGRRQATDACAHDHHPQWLLRHDASFLRSATIPCV